MAIHRSISVHVSVEACIYSYVYVRAYMHTSVGVCVCERDCYPWVDGSEMFLAEHASRELTEKVGKKVSQGRGSQQCLTPREDQKMPRCGLWRQEDEYAVEPFTMSIGNFLTFWPRLLKTHVKCAYTITLIVVIAIQGLASRQLLLH